MERDFGELKVGLAVSHGQHAPTALQPAIGPVLRSMCCTLHVGDGSTYWTLKNEQYSKVCC